MNSRRAVWQSLLVALIVAAASGLAAQPDPAIADAQRILDLLREGKADAVAAQFNPKMAAAISLEQLRQVWAAVEQQAGTFGTVIDSRVDVPPEFKDFKAVTLGCQFEKAVADFQVVFDAEKKITGLRITPRRQ